MPPAPPAKATLRPASVILLLAWLVLLAGLAATAGYVLMLPAGPIPTGAMRAVVAFGPPADAQAPLAETVPPAAVAANEMPSPPPEPGPAPAAVPQEAGPQAAAGARRWQQYSQAFDAADKRPRIAIVLTGLGLSGATTEAAITQLPAAITLSFSPYGRELGQWIALARRNKHEIMLDLPMEPTSYPDDDPGPKALLTALSPAQNLERLNWTLDRASGYVGVATVMGSRFAASETAVIPILEALKEQGLIFLDNRSSQESIAGRLAAKIGVASAINDRTLDSAQANGVAIDARLVQLEDIARAEGFTVAMGRPYPMTIERLREWAKGLPDRGFVLAPISAVVDRQRHHLGVTQSTQAK